MFLNSSINILHSSMLQSFVKTHYYREGVFTKVPLKWTFLYRILIKENK